MKEVFIVGAGSVGSVLAGLLAKMGLRVTVATNDLAAARRFLPKRGRIRVVKADASKVGSVTRAAKGSDLIINAAHSAFNLVLMRAALRIRANYLDLDSRLTDWKHAEQLRMHHRFGRAGLFALMNAGVSPGLTNLLAAEAAARFTSLTSLKFRILEEQDADRLIPTWSPSVLKDELKAWPLVWRKGRFGFGRPLKAAETFRFPRPYGKRRVVSIYGDEIATIPLFLKVRHADYKAGGKEMELVIAGEKPSMGVPTPAEMRQLVKTGVVRDARLIVSVEGSGWSKAKGRRSKATMHAVFPDIRRIIRKAPGATYIGYPTALCAAAFALAIPHIESRGVFPPEALGPEVRKAVLARLKKDSVKFVTMRE